MNVSQYDVLGHVITVKPDVKIIIELYFVIHLDFLRLPFYIGREGIYREYDRYS